MTTRYPLEVSSVVRDRTFYVLSHLKVASSKDNSDDKRGEEHPLMTYNSISRYEFVVINEEKKGATAKITINEMLNVMRLSKKLYNSLSLEELMPSNAQQQETENLPDCFTVKIMGGKMKGMTPVQYLKANPETGIEDMAAQGKFLKEHLSGKYAQSNTRQMNALATCINMHKAGTLNLDEVEEVFSRSYTLYEGGMRPIMSERRKLPDGVPSNCKFVYELKVVWNVGQNNPISVIIENYYAPVIRTEKGLLNVQKQSRDPNHVTFNTMKLSVDEWMNVLYYIEMDMKRFEMINAKKTYEDAMAVDRAQRSSYQNNSAPSYNNSYQNNNSYPDPVEEGTGDIEFTVPEF